MLSSCKNAYEISKKTQPSKLIKVKQSDKAAVIVIAYSDK